ncbi:YifB family Mg chelatase-like AAA ATPase [Exilibacterium tricleocarpae]|uniref:YifB family Mg chelatase-like AAA ATPase n=1 Tax=Exilibacterium tricleocarpae TaxID=2591008 RepID=A0A545T0M4_9GAMM|nr:YifB family Mg chelatase-like AAA ATPase [Exilibacterium tricleocarpae]TQV70756.1 YifB family Mg chelatase-like AAA ATPase [Exilibacterium tricleocarpae]
MSLAIVYSRAQIGIDAPLVTVETHLSNGLPGLSIVGLPETAVKESKERVRCALLNSHFDFPARRIIINLAPADLPKQGGRYDLAIALGILIASDQLPGKKVRDYEFLGELALSGDLRSVRGCLPGAIACGKAGRMLVLPRANGAEAALCADTQVFTATNLLRVCAHLRAREPLPRAEPAVLSTTSDYPDLSDVKGQVQAKRALEIAAAGGHNLLFYGPPGTGKTMLASRLPGLLPPLDDDEALAVAAVHSVAGADVAGCWLRRPFQSPHHTASAVALVGGGSQPKPGEISLAHKGVLFLDELPEFQRQVLEVLREPLESGEICISRARAQVRFPADFQLIAAMNPCPCGYQGANDGRCSCTPDQLRRYRDKLSGPLLDRIDLQVPVLQLRYSELQSTHSGETTAVVSERVFQCRSLQIKRQQKTNAQLNNREVEKLCRLDRQQQQLLDRAMNKLGFSARVYHRILKVARTIADLGGEDVMKTPHLAEAITYHGLNRKG